MCIEETKPNWSILKLTPESEYDKQKKELETVLSEIISSQQFFENTTKKKKIEQINERVKLIKKQIDKSNEHIKQININKKNLFTEIDKYAKELKKTLNHFKFRNQEQSLINIKETLVKNKLTLENIIAANQNFSANISEFRKSN
jgi:chromosome segregation ATPase